ncbi:hypothetical protein BO99DRAFT_435958 [Aspergillus violaceofuscus CBS 115571]|uniref:Uncharacterized protein n=1 Tax=Aspergillus violaceofuscus (strain CBS 115571) TaxID=1450538 RepID=A0A2V5GX20_ASPV1|nr:hypothetical protein BO99DRAFT_435958 [Aspergillus violaceofuscus CBS 115571]
MAGVMPSASAPKEMPTKNQAFRDIFAQFMRGEDMDKKSIKKNFRTATKPLREDTLHRAHIIVPYALYGRPAANPLRDQLAMSLFARLVPAAALSLKTTAPPRPRPRPSLLSPTRRPPPMRPPTPLPLPPSFLREPLLGPAEIVFGNSVHYDKHCGSRRCPKAYNAWTSPASCWHTQPAGPDWVGRITQM